MSLCGSKTSARAGKCAGAARPSRSCPSPPRRRGRWSRPDRVPRPSRCPRSRARRPARRSARPAGVAAITPWARRIATSGAGTAAARPLTLGNGSMCPSALRIGPEGGSALFRSLRIAERVMLESTLDGSRNWLAVCSRTAPTIHTRPSPMQARHHGAEQAVDEPQARQPEEAADAACDALEDRAEQAAGDQCAAQAEQRRVRRIGSAGQDQRPDPRAHEGATQEADQRHHADQEAAGVARERHQRDQHQDHDVDDRHLVRRLGARRAPARCGCDAAHARYRISFTFRRITGQGHPRTRRSRGRRVFTRTVPLALVAIAALAFGLYEAGAPGRDQRAIVRRYAADWAHDDYRAMWATLNASSRRRVSEPEFVAELSGAAQTATASSLSAGRLLSIRGQEARVSFVVRTHVFGRLHEVLQIPLSGSGGGTRVVFNTSLLFPGMRSGELLSRRTLFGRRGTLLADNGQPLAEGTSLATPIPTVASAIAGTLGPIPAAQATMYAQEGYPLGAKVGVDGLEEIFQRRLAGRLGGELLAGTRVLARAKPGHGATVHTTIDPTLEQDTIDALGGNYGGITVINPAHGRDRGGGRDRLHIGATAGLDVQDHHRNRRTCGRDHDPVQELSVRVERVSRRLQDAERRRRGLRRDTDQRVRDLMRHHLRPARRAARWREAGQHRAEVRLRPAHRDSQRARELDPGGRGDRQPALGRRLRDRPGTGTGEHARDGGRRRRRSPTAAAARCRRWCSAPSRASCA